MALLDISRSVSPTTAVWPGDQNVQLSWTEKLGRGDASVNVAALRLSTHAGTHVDAPYHVSEEGGKTDELPLSAFVGLAQVVDVQGEESVLPKHVDHVDAGRVLFKTSASTLADHEWPDRITPIRPSTIHALNDQGVVLIGTDAPSVDPLESKTLPAHHALLETGIVNLEGLSLDEVRSGRYHLMALPLKISGGDAAPVRAVLSDSIPRTPGE